MRNDRVYGRAVVLFMAFLASLLAAGLLAGCGDSHKPHEQDSGFEALSLAEQAAVTDFSRTHSSLPGKDRLVLCESADFGADRVPDIIVIYASVHGTQPLTGHAANAMCALLAPGKKSAAAGTTGVEAADVGAIAAGVPNTGAAGAVSATGCFPDLNAVLDGSGVERISTLRAIARESYSWEQRVDGFKCCYALIFFYI